LCGTLLLSVTGIAWGVYYLSDFDGIVFGYVVVAFVGTLLAVVVGVVNDHTNRWA
jgi:hypothetical protein